jgi:predicted GH43/DUF377 family glycosyl hydrolase
MCASVESVTQNRHVPDLLHRYPANPLLSAADWPYLAHTVFNPGATQLASGETLLLVRVEDRRGMSHLTAARSSDGITGWRIDAQPTFSAGPERYPEELWGVEDAGKIGLSAQPIETDEGWLVIYHGVRDTPAGALYRVGLALLDLEDPRRVLRRGDEWVVGPQAPYEVMGDIPNVVFPCGAVLDAASGELSVYYGAADTCVGLMTAQIGEVLDWLRTQPVGAAAHG